ncbi:MAG: hypothetical protein QNL04_09130 [SAR324 cluster bacterium]|nr:hypothetical protein [SAR324 cluster bacterium]
MATTEGLHKNGLTSVMISSYIQKNTIINTEHDHTSFISTMNEKWDFGHLTDRDKNANTFSGVFSGEKRA